MNVEDLYKLANLPVSLIIILILARQITPVMGAMLQALDEMKSRDMERLKLVLEYNERIILMQQDTINNLLSMVRGNTNDRCTNN